MSFDRKVRAARAAAWRASPWDYLPAVVVDKRGRHYGPDDLFDALKLAAALPHDIERPVIRMVEDKPEPEPAQLELSL